MTEIESLKRQIETVKAELDRRIRLADLAQNADMAMDAKAADDAVLAMQEVLMTLMRLIPPPIDSSTPSHPRQTP